MDPRMEPPHPGGSRSRVSWGFVARCASIRGHGLRGAVARGPGPTRHVARRPPTSGRRRATHRCNCLHRRCAPASDRSMPCSMAPTTAAPPRCPSCSRWSPRQSNARSTTACCPAATAARASPTTPSRCSTSSFIAAAKRHSTTTSKSSTASAPRPPVKVTSTAFGGSRWKSSRCAASSRGLRQGQPLPPHPLRSASRPLLLRPSAAGCRPPGDA